MATWANLFNWNNFKEQQEQPRNGKDARITTDTGSTAIETFALNGSELTEQDIMGIPAVSASIDTITNSIAQLPIEIYQKMPDGESIKVTDDYRLNLLNSKPNETMSGYAFKRKVIKDILLYGTSKSYIEYADETSNIIEALYPLDMSKTTIEVKTNNGYQFFGIIYLDSNAGRQVFYDDLLLSIMKDSDNGIVGKGLISEHYDILKLAKSQSDYENHLLENGATPTSVLESDQKISNDVSTKIRNSWRRLYAGVKNAGNTVILESGLHYKPISYGPDALQLTDGKKSVISDIARILNIPESMINSTANKYDSAEQNNLWFLQTTLSPLMVSYENALDNSILTEDEKAQGYYFQFDASGMNKVTTEVKNQVIIEQLNAGLISMPAAAKALGIKLEDNVADYYKLTTGFAMYVPETNTISVPNTGVVMDVTTGKVTQNGVAVEPGGVKQSGEIQDDSKEEDK